MIVPRAISPPTMPLRSHLSPTDEATAMSAVARAISPPIMPNMNTNDQPAKLPGRKRRKPNRLPGYDYSAPGYYFITICTERHEPLLGRICTREDGTASASMVLNDTGRIVEEAILAIPSHYPGAAIDKYVVMPNHVHWILTIPPEPERPLRVPQIVGQFKRAVSVKLGKSIWQLGFHDHVIRGEADYREIWTYIDNNPLKWALDKYYRET